MSKNDNPEIWDQEEYFKKEVEPILKQLHEKCEEGKLPLFVQIMIAERENAEKHVGIVMQWADRYSLSIKDIDRMHDERDMAGDSRSVTRDSLEDLKFDDDDEL